MAVQILNDMPDAAVDRGEPVTRPRSWNDIRATPRERGGNRAVFIAITIGLHAVVALAFASVKYAERQESAPAPIVASIVDAPDASEEAPPLTPPPMVEISYTLPQPDQISIEAESITAPTAAIASAAITPTQAVAPPMIESVEYVRAPEPVYPRESARRREYGIVMLRVLVDAAGRPAQIQIERSSGHDRLDAAARDAVRKALFRPHEVNGVAQAAQVLIPVEFVRRST